MIELTENQIEKIIDILRESPFSSYYISKQTRISQATLGNYRNGRTKPTQANALILKRFFGIEFLDENGSFLQNNGGVIVGHDLNGDANIRQYYSNIPDALRARIDLLEERIKEKDEQIKEKDAQINKLLEILSKK